MRSPLRTFVDWYIQRYHAEDYLHVSQIKDEISKRIENAVARNNEIRDRELEEAVKTERLKHKIIEDGYCAEIMNMEKIVEDAKNLRADVEAMHFKVIERKNQIVLVAAEVKQERAEIISELASTMKKLDKLEIKTGQINDEIKDKQIEDEKQLRINN